MTSKRLFIGVRVIAEQQPDLLEVYRKLKIGCDKREMTIKWAPPENWHVTLKFLGSTPTEQLPTLFTKLEKAASQGVAARISSAGIGAFPEERFARVIWAGVSRSQALLDLQSCVESAFALDDQLGENDDDREFHPHVTLGRLRSAGSVRDLISPFVRKRFHDVLLEELILFESVQKGPFPLYFPLHRAKIPPNQTDD